MIKQTKYSNVLLTVFLTFFALLISIPFYYLLVTTFKSPTEAALYPLCLPKSFNLRQYCIAWQEMNYPRVLLNTTIIVAVAVILNIILASMAAYSFARKSGRLFQGLFFLMLAGIMIPAQINVTPLFRLIKGLGLMNNRFSVIFIYSFTQLSFSIFLFRGFISTVPLELEEAAHIDGYGVIHTFFKIDLPLIQPVTVTVVILNALYMWNDFIIPLLFLQTRGNATILLEVYRNVGQFATDWTNMFPMLMLGMIPMILFYIALQKWIIEGIATGAVKG